MGIDVLKEKLKEASFATLPISLLVLLLALTFVPIDNSLLLSFVIGTIFVIVGIALFTIGSEVSMTQIGSHIAIALTKSKNILLVIVISFILGVSITIAEPDLQVLGTSVPNINTSVLIFTVAVGVGIYLIISMLRMYLRISLRTIIVISYMVVFILAFISDKSFVPVSFDSGGVTTGPITVPFIMAFGVGATALRSDENAKNDSFGLIGLCSIGPILAVQILGLIYKTDIVSESIIVKYFSNSVELGKNYLYSFPKELLNVSFAILPIFVFFILFQVFSLRLNFVALKKILLGILFTFVGLVLFLTGVNVGFMPLGYTLGDILISQNFTYIVIPLAGLMGWFIIKAEPAVQVLKNQVEELSAGAISGKTMEIFLSLSICLAMALAVLRAIVGFSILYYMIPGYLIAIILTFFVDPMFTAIAFDAGGVASGPMTATFMLPFVTGITKASGGDIMLNAFGLVAVVAMMPLIVLQIMGLVAIISEKNELRKLAVEIKDDYKVVELWEM